MWKNIMLKPQERKKMDMYQYFGSTGYAHLQAPFRQDNPQEAFLPFQTGFNFAFFVGILHALLSNIQEPAFALY